VALFLASMAFFTHVRRRAWDGLRHRLPWVFFIVMQLPSFGRPVLAQVQTVDEQSCGQFLKMVVTQIKGMHFNYEVTVCVAKPTGA